MPTIVSSWPPAPRLFVSGSNGDKDEGHPPQPSVPSTSVSLTASSLQASESRATSAFPASSS